MLPCVSQALFCLFVCSVLLFLLLKKKERLKSPEILKPAPTLIYFEVTISISAGGVVSCSEQVLSQTHLALAELRRASDVFLPGRCVGGRSVSAEGKRHIEL